MEKIGKIDVQKVVKKSFKMDGDAISPGVNTARSTTRVSAPLNECFIDISCDRPCYFPGDTVSAQVSIRSKKPINGDFIQVEVIGKEKAIYQKFADPEGNKDYKHTFLSHK